MASLLCDVRPTDLQTFAIAAVGLTLTALMASLMPALRAARIDPAETLRLCLAERRERDNPAYRMFLGS
jgi:hypothetical protein